MSDKLEEMLVAFKEMLFHSDAMSIKPTTTRQVETTQITTRESQLLQVVLSKAADEITRLNAENEELRAKWNASELRVSLYHAEQAEAEAARLNALVDEMREGLERVITHPAVELCDCGEPGCLTFDLRALIKASRESGHG